MTGSTIGFRLLGPLEFFDGEQWSPIDAPKQRALLAILLINVNHPVSADRLVAELWGEAPPPSAAGLLAGYVWRLRRCLNDRDGRVLRTRSPGYQLVLPAGTTDLQEYEAHVTAGRRSLAAGDLAGAVGTLSAALDMWRGAPLADVALVPSVLTESARLEEARLAVVEARIDAEIGLGRHETLLPELKLMVAQFPLRERLHAHLMVALYRTGQQAEALGAYRDLRRLLVDEFGIEPSKPLRELQARILCDDPTLVGADPRTTSTSQLSQPAVIRALPPDVPVFVGRTAELGWLTGRLAGGAQRCAIHGMAGVGKTSLAVHAAHQLSASFPDGQVYLNLGAGSRRGPLRPAEAVGRLLSALGWTDEPPRDEQRATVLLHAAMSGRQVLIVLDDVHDGRQVRQLLPVEPGCAVILIGRAAATAVDGPGLLRLDRLPEAAAVRLLHTYAGTGRMDADHAATTRIARLCDHLPLALRIAAARLARRPEWTVDELAARLADPRSALTTLTCDGLSARASLRAGALLAESFADPLTMRALGQLGILDQPVVSTAELAAALEVATADAEQAMERLVDAGLVEVLRIDRYRVSGLVREFARSEPMAVNAMGSTPHRNGLPRPAHEPGR